MDYLFLDFDGVINSQGWNNKAARKHPRLKELWESPTLELLADEDLALAQINPRCVKLVDQLAQTFSCQIVISSSWRKEYEVSELRNWLWQKGLLEATVIDSTPHHALAYTGLRWGKERGMEIEEWLLRNVPHDQLPETKILILDDNDNMGRLNKFLVHTSFYKGGLLDKHLKTARRIWDRTPFVGDVILKPEPAWTPRSLSILYPGEADVR